MLRPLIRQLAGSQELNDDQVRAAIAQLTEERVAAELKAEFLTALARKGETPAELAAFVRALRDRALAPPLDVEVRQREILDVVGTGGDQLGTFNISTTVALLCAATGVTVAKHGNRAATSRCGSADVLEALGIPIDLAPEAAAHALRAQGFAFFFAPRYHPAFRHVAAARQLCATRGQRTVFNLLGPLLNPARPTAQLVGVPRPALCGPLARVLQMLGVRRGMVVCGQVRSEGAHLDELSTLGENTIAEFYQERALAESVMAPEQFPLQPATLSDLAGGDAAANAGIVRQVLRGEERGPRRDIVLLNAAAALWVAGRTRSLSDGWELAAQVIDGGQAAAKLAALVIR